MTALLTPPRPTSPQQKREPLDALALWRLLPLPVRVSLSARLPLRCTLAGGGEMMCVPVGDSDRFGVRMLSLQDAGPGRVSVRLWQAIPHGCGTLAEATTATGTGLVSLLRAWACEFDLG